MKSLNKVKAVRRAVIRLALRKGINLNYRNVVKGIHTFNGYDTYSIYVNLVNVLSYTHPPSVAVSMASVS